MAKELAMLERTEAGRSARKYFLECERRLKAIQTGVQIEYRLSDVERRIFEEHQRLYETHQELMAVLETDLDMVTLPYLLREVLEDAGIDAQGIERMELSGYGITLMAAKIAARQMLRESDVAYRLTVGEISPRLLNQVQLEIGAMFYGRRSGMLEAGVAKALKRFGVN